MEALTISLNHCELNNIVDINAKTLDSLLCVSALSAAKSIIYCSLSMIENEKKKKHLKRKS